MMSNCDLFFGKNDDITNNKYTTVTFIFFHSGVWLFVSLQVYDHRYKAVLDGVETDSMMEIDPGQRIEIFRMGNGSEEILEVHDFKNVSKRLNKAMQAILPLLKTCCNAVIVSSLRRRKDYDVHTLPFSKRRLTTFILCWNHIFFFSNIFSSFVTLNEIKVWQTFETSEKQNTGNYTQWCVHRDQKCIWKNTYTSYGNWI